MKKYIKPELDCCMFEPDDVLTTSGTATTEYISSLKLLQNEIAADPSLSGLGYAEDSWILK